MKGVKHPGLLIGLSLGASLEAYTAHAADLSTQAALLAPSVGSVALGIMFFRSIKHGTEGFGAGLFTAGSLTLLALLGLNVASISEKVKDTADTTKRAGDQMADGIEQLNDKNVPEYIGKVLLVDGVEGVVVVPGSFETNGCASNSSYRVASGEGPLEIAVGAFSGAHIGANSAVIYTEHPGSMPWPNDDILPVYRDVDEQFTSAVCP